MNETTFKELQATMPWRQHSFQTPKGQVIIQIINKFGQEVQLLTMVAFIEMITAKLAARTEKEPENADTAKAG